MVFDFHGYSQIWNFDFFLGILVNGLSLLPIIPGVILHMNHISFWGGLLDVNSTTIGSITGEFNFPRSLKVP